MLSECLPVTLPTQRHGRCGEYALFYTKGQNCSWMGLSGAATIRTILRIIDTLPVLYLVGIIVILLTERNQRVGDIVADTAVVRARET